MKESKPDIWAAFGGGQALLGSVMLAVPHAWQTTGYSNQLAVAPIPLWGAVFVTTGSLSVAARLLPVSRNYRAAQFAVSRAIAVGQAMAWGGWWACFLPRFIEGQWAVAAPLILWGLAVVAPLMDLRRAFRRGRGE